MQAFHKSSPDKKIALESPRISPEKKEKKTATNLPQTLLPNNSVKKITISDFYK